LVGGTFGIERLAAVAGSRTRLAPAHVRNRYVKLLIEQSGFIAN
jgi:hypothetical protein